MTTLAVQSISLTGLTPSYSAGTADGHEFLNDGNVFLHIKNTSGSAITVTVDAVATVDGLAIADVSVSVPQTSGDKMIGPFNPSVFNQAGGLAYVDYSASAGLTLAAVKLP